MIQGRNAFGKFNQDERKVDSSKNGPLTKDSDQNERMEDESNSNGDDHSYTIDNSESTSHINNRRPERVGRGRGSRLKVDIPRQKEERKVSLRQEKKEEEVINK